MSKEKRTFRFLQLLMDLEPEEVFGLAHLLGMKLGTFQVLDPEGKVVSTSISEFREVDRKELEEKNYKVKLVQKTGEDLIKELINSFSSASWGEQRELLKILEDNRVRNLLKENTPPGNYGNSENSEVPGNNEATDLQGARSIDFNNISDGGQEDGTPTED